MCLSRDSGFVRITNNNISESRSPTRPDYHILPCRIANGIDGRSDISDNYQLRFVGCICSSQGKQFYLLVSVAPGNLNAIFQAVKIRVLFWATSLRMEGFFLCMVSAAIRTSQFGILMSLLFGAYVLFFDKQADIRA